MRVMVIVKATKDSEAGVPPSKELITAMGNYNEELVKAGIMLAGEGLHPSSKGARVRFSGDNRLRAVGDAKPRCFQHCKIVRTVAHGDHPGGG